MRVTTLCEYLMSTHRPDGHWPAFKFIRAIKAEGFSRYSDINVGNRICRLTPENQDEALGWAGEMLTPILNQEFTTSLIALVPIPGSQCTTFDAVEKGRVFQIANVIKALRPAATSVRPLLCWDRPMVPAHKGGHRSAEELAPRYLVKQPRGILDKVATCVLIDDVLTHAGHLRSAAARLRAAGYMVANTAFAVGRTVWPADEYGVTRTPSDNAFRVETEELEDFTWPG